MAATTTPGEKVLYRTAYIPYFKQNTSLWSAPEFIEHLTQFIHRAAAVAASARRREPLPGLRLLAMPPVVVLQGQSAFATAIYTAEDAQTPMR